MRRAALLLALAGCPGKRAETPVDHTTPAECAAAVDRSPLEATVHATWVQAWRSLQPVEPEESPADDADARAWLCAYTGCEGDGPWIVSTGDDTERAFHLAYAVPGGVAVFADLGAGMLGARCGWEDAVTIEPGPPFRVHVVSVVGDTFYMNIDADELRECGDADETCSTACFATSHTTTDLFFDLASRTRTLAITREAHAEGQFHQSEDFVYDSELAITPDAVTVSERSSPCATIALR